jgi:phosphatidylglycerophosphate synthase
MISRWLRRRYGGILAPPLVALGDCGITPGMLTAGALLMMIIAGALLSADHFIFGGIVLLAGGILDGIDGELARVTGAASPRGAFLDSICDHAGDFAVYLGLCWSCVHNRCTVGIMLIFLAMFGSLFGSHVRSRAGMLGIELKDVGLFTRFERVALLVIGLLADALTPALWALAILNNVSALQRVARALRLSRHRLVRSGERRELSFSGR